MECVVMIYFTGLHGFLALATVYPIYQIAIRGPIISFLYRQHRLFTRSWKWATPYLLMHTSLAILFSLCAGAPSFSHHCPASRYIVSAVGTSDDSYATKYLVLCSTLGGLSIIFDEGMTAIHIVEQRHVLIFTHILTRYPLKGIFLLLYTICSKIDGSGWEHDVNSCYCAGCD